MSISTYFRPNIHQNVPEKSELKLVKYGYVRGYPKRPATQIGLLKISGDNPLGAIQFLWKLVFSSASLMLWKISIIGINKIRI
jgi:hypothetical protein